MQANSLTPDLSVCGQIDPADVRSAKDAGFRAIICNRPDGEAQGQCEAADIRAAAEAAGLAFHYNPVTPETVTPEKVRAQGEALAQADGKVLAYCGSGKRAAMLWMLANPDGLSAEERIARADAAGYDLSALRGQL